MAMERVTVEQNGERFTLEVAEGTSDAEITSYITGQQGSLPSTPSPAAAAFQTVAPALATPGTPTGLGSIAKEIGSAVSPYAKSAVEAAVSGYKAHPILTPLVDAVGIGTMGTPLASTYNSVMGAADQYQRAKDAVSGVGKVLSTSNLIESPITGNPFPESVPAYRQMQKAAPEFAQRLSDAYQKGGGNNGVKALLQTEEAAQFMKNPAFAAAADEYLGKVPGAFKQMGKVLGPIARGIGKVAGPVGMGMNMYDAAQMARETQLGQRLAGGQGQQAQQNFRQMNTQYGAPISAPEAQNVLQSGSPRDIQAFGGQERLNQMIREAAAKKALAFPNQ